MATVDAHYDRAGIGRAILDGLRAAGAGADAPTPGVVMGVWRAP
jgi:hypothetical protein